MRSNGEHYASQISEEREYVNQIKENLLLLINKMSENSKEGIAKKWINSHGDKAVENIPDREVKDALGIVDDEISKLLYKYECYRNNTDYYNVSPTYNHQFNFPSLPSMGNDVFEESDEVPLSRDELYKEIELSFGDIHRPYPPSLRKHGKGGGSSKKLIRNSFVRNSNSKPRPFLSPLSQQPPITISNQNSSSSNDEISQQLMEEIYNADITENDMKSDSKTDNESYRHSSLFEKEKNDNIPTNNNQNEIRSDVMTLTISEDTNINSQRLHDEDVKEQNTNQISSNVEENNKTISKDEVDLIDDDFYNYEENEVEDENENKTSINPETQPVEVNNSKSEEIVDDFEVFSKSKSSVFSQESQHRLSKCVSQFVNQLLESIVEDIKPKTDLNENKETIPQQKSVSSIYSSKSSIKFEDSNVLNNDKSKSSTNSLSFKSSTAFKESFSTDDVEKRQTQQQQDSTDNLSRCVSQFINQLVGAVADEMKIVRESKNSSKSSLKHFSSKSLHANKDGNNKSVVLEPTIEENKEEEEYNFDDDVFNEDENVEITEEKVGKEEFNEEEQTNEEEEKTEENEETKEEEEEINDKEETDNEKEGSNEIENEKESNEEKEETNKEEEEFNDEERTKEEEEEEINEKEESNQKEETNREEKTNEEEKFNDKEVTTTKDDEETSNQEEENNEEEDFEKEEKEEETNEEEKIIYEKEETNQKEETNLDEGNEENTEIEKEKEEENEENKQVEDEGVGCGTDDMSAQVDFEYKEGMNSHFIHPSDFQSD